MTAAGASPTFGHGTIAFVRRALRRDWVSPIIYPLASVALFLGVWEVVLRILDLPIWLVPKPSDFLPRLVEDYALISGHAWATSTTVVIGFALGVVIAVPLALAIVSVRTLERGFYPVIVFLNIMPKTIIGPIIVIWVGVSPLVSVIIVFLMCFFPVLVDSMSGFRSVDPRLYYITRSMGASRWQAFRFVRMPASMVFIFAGMKIGIVKATEGVIIAEFIASNKGLGFMIFQAMAFLDLRLIFSGLVAMALVALVFNGLMLSAERMLMPWARQYHA